MGGGERSEAGTKIRSKAPGPLGDVAGEQTSSRTR